MRVNIRMVGSLATGEVIGYLQMTEIEHPEIRYVVYSIRRTDGTLNGKPPSMQHDPDCTQYNFRGGSHGALRCWRLKSRYGP
jgi:hypothetical protein